MLSGFVYKLFGALNFNIFFNQRGLFNHTRRVCPEGVKRPRRVPVEKEKRADNFGLNRD